MRRVLTTSRLRVLTWIVAVAAGALAPLAIPLLLGYTLAWRDTARIHAPLRGLVVDALGHFRLPLWNPYESTGLPLLAQLVHGVLHPVSVLAAFVVPAAGMDGLIVAHVLLAALGAAFLAKQLGASEAGAAAAGLGFGLSGYVLSMSSVLHYLAAAGTAPWAIAAIRMSGGRAHGVAAGAAAVAALHFAGDPQWTLVAAILGAALAVEHRGLRGLGGAVAAVVLGTALAGVQLVPSWAYLSETARGSMELTESEQVRWALAPWRLLELAAPGFFSGRPGLSLSAPVFVALGGSPVAIESGGPGYSVPFVPSVHAGAMLLALAVGGIVTSRAGRVLGIAVIVLLWLALGFHLGAQQALSWVPVWRSFRYAEKMVGPLTLCLALLAGLGVRRLELGTSRRIRVAAAAAAVVACGLAAWLAAGGGESLLRNAGAGQVASLARQRLALGFAHAAAGTSALAILLAVSARRPTVRSSAPVIAAALVFLHAAAAAPFALHAGSPEARDPRPLAELAGTVDVVRVATPLRGVLRDEPSRLDSSDRMLALESRMGVSPYPAAAGVDQIDAYTALVPWQRVLVDNTLGWERDPRYWHAMRRYAITHVALRAPRGPREHARAEAAVAGGRPVLDVPAWGYSVWEVPHRPWATFVSTVMEAQTPGEALRVLAASARGAGPDVVVEGWSPDGGFPPRLPQGRVLRIERGTETLRIEAESAEHALLVVNDAYWPGWTAHLDGQPVPILRADALVRAVPWPAGSRALEMRYDPPEVRTGIWISGAASLIAVSLVALGLRRARRPTAEQASAGEASSRNLLARKQQEVLRSPRREMILQADDLDLPRQRPAGNAHELQGPLPQLVLDESP